MTDLIVDVLIPLIFGIIGVILTFYIGQYINDRRGETKIDKETDELKLENILGKMLFYLVLVASVIICCLPLVAINTFDRSDYMIYLGMILFFSILLTISYFFVWGHVIIFGGREIRRICWWKKNISRTTEDIKRIYKTGWDNWIIEFRDGKKIMIPEYYTSSDYLIYELREIVPESKWI